MRIIRFEDDHGAVRYAREVGDGQVECLASAPLDRAHPDETLTSTGETLAYPARILAPIPPSNILCIGMNYVAHAKEGGREPPTRPVMFMKPTGALNHPGGPIRLPACQMDGPETDYECELAVVIGKPALDVSEDRALDYVFGYTCANDVSARQWQRVGGGGQWSRGKGFDTFCPLGPVLVTADEIPDPQTLAISTTLNGQVMQRSHTSKMIFPVRTLIAFLSQDTTLQPGTVVLTGTPEGVGGARKPPVWLKAGDEVTVEIEKIGRLTNPVVE